MLLVHETASDFASGEFDACGVRAASPAVVELLQETQGSFTSQALTLARGISRVVLSANFSGQSHSGLDVQGQVSVRTGNEWSPWYRLLRKGTPPGHEGVTETETAQVDVDVLKLTHPAMEVRYKVSWSSLDRSHGLRRVALCLAGDPEPVSSPAARPSSGRLHVPFLSQWEATRHPVGRVCSPTCLAMVAQYYGVPLSADQLADWAFDADHKVYGNWAANMLAMSLCGFRALVEQTGDAGVLDCALERKQPVITSIAFGESQLSGAPVGSTDGHLVVVAGVTEEGNILARDPAARGNDDWREYARPQFERAWLGHGGYYYDIRPEETR